MIDADLPPSALRACPRANGTRKNGRRLSPQEMQERIALYREKIAAVQRTALSKLASDLASLRGKTCNRALMQDLCDIIELLDADVQCTACGVRAKIRKIVEANGNDNEHEYEYVHHAIGTRNHRVGVVPPILRTQ